MVAIAIRSTASANGACLYLPGPVEPWVWRRNFPWVFAYKFWWASYCRDVLQANFDLPTGRLTCWKNAEKLWTLKRSIKPRNPDKLCKSANNPQCLPFSSTISSCCLSWEKQQCRPENRNNRNKTPPRYQYVFTCILADSQMILTIWLCSLHCVFGFRVFDMQKR